MPFFLKLRYVCKPLTQVRDQNVNFPSSTSLSVCIFLYFFRDSFIHTPVSPTPVLSPPLLSRLFPSLDHHRPHQLTSFSSCHWLDSPASSSLLFVWSPSSVHSSLSSIIIDLPLLLPLSSRYSCNCSSPSSPISSRPFLVDVDELLLLFPSVYQGCSSPVLLN